MAEVRPRPPPPDWLSDQAAPTGIPQMVKDLANEVLPSTHATLTGTAMILVVNEALNFVADRIRPDLGFVEICSGWGECCYWVRKQNIRAHEYDAGTRSSDESLNTALGLFWAGVLCLRLQPHGTAFFAPECSTWGFLNMGTSGRNIAVFGNDTRDDVARANIQVEAVSMLVMLCDKRRVYITIEQPTDSVMATHPSLKFALQAAQVIRLRTYMGSFGLPMPKPTHLYTTFPPGAAQTLVKSAPKRGQKRSPSFHCVTNAGWVTGGKKLSATEHYPTEFCQALAKVVSTVQGMRRAAADNTCRP